MLSALLINVGAATLNANTFSFFILPMGRELGWSRGEMSWALTARLLVVGLTGPIIGSFIDRFGSRWLGATAGVLAGACLFLISRVDGLWQLYLIFALSGLTGFGASQSAIIAMVPVGKWFQTHRSRAIAFASAGLPLGAMIWIQAAQWLIATFGWRTAWLVLAGCVVVIVTPATILLMKRSPEDHGLRPYGSGAEPVDGTPSPVAQVVQVSWTRAQAVRAPVMWLILAAMVVQGMALSGTLLHRVPFWLDLGMPPAMVALGTAVDPFTVIFSGILFGLVGERVPVRFLGAIGSFGFAAAMTPMIFTAGQIPTLFLHNAVWGLFAGAYLTAMNLIWVTYFGRRSLGAIQGITLPSTILANAFGPPLFGFLLDRGVDSQTVWILALAMFVTAGLLVLNARPPKLPAARSGQ